ncbi:hypothetical protein IIA28_20045, partial [candidate division KSB1 bacterium]|nr:hypothetical protein [candidate division KSB1 bacterium]
MNAEIDKVLASEEPIFAQAVKAVVTAEVPGLKELLDQRPDLVTNRAKAAHRSTLLHYTAANGIENELQLSGESIYQLIQNSAPAERPSLQERAIEIAGILLDAGAVPRDVLGASRDGRSPRDGLRVGDVPQVSVCG